MTHDAEPQIFVSKVEETVRNYVNELGDQRITLRGLGCRLAKRVFGDSTPPSDPVRTKNLQKCAGFLHCLASLTPNASLEQSSPLGIYLTQLSRPDMLSSDSAWELADGLEAELIRLSDEIELGVRLREASENRTGAGVFGQKHLAELTGRLKDGDEIVNEARHVLLRMHDLLVTEYRRDRAKIRLRGAHLHKMAWFLFVMLLLFCFMYLAARGAAVDGVGPRPYWLLVVAIAGATGSVLSRAVKIGKQPLHAEVGAVRQEPPLGLRELMSGWKVFLAQPVIGATAAMFVFLIFSGNLVQVLGFQPTSIQAYAVLAFLTGFSEPFFLGVLDKISE